jgi:phosphoribosylglycinamide formyltransferase 1
MKNDRKMNAAVFASGSGSNAENLIRFFEKRDDLSIALVVSNKSDAGVLERAQRLGVPYQYISPKAIRENEGLTELLNQYQIDMVILAGFLQLVPAYLIHQFPGKVVNIHPALLPKYGGRGMYGMHVHEAVVAAGEKESGITIHEVNERYDEGRIIFQATCRVEEGDSPEDVANKIHELEYKHFPQVVADWIKTRTSK